MVGGSCHCGAVGFTLAAPPTVVSECNCSLCRRHGALWAYYPPDQVALTMAEGATVPYIQGDRLLATHHCATCGCITHWVAIVPEHAGRMGVNARLLDDGLPEGVERRLVDGASF